ncbi:hypothetical protein KI387_018501, partial [Taxus chinensis]
IKFQEQEQISPLESAIEEANNDYHTNVEFDKEIEERLGFWTQSSANTSDLV